ncbi:MAG: HAD-IC family P-type ATPase [Jatrophihabitans sp.]|uniref:HAD-IC family P-type ATPase n=1 Tax=Jatrophihabitans sp. TaxID=1932789 RepID=UPI0039162F82
MPVPRGRQIPFTSALSGLVLLGVMFTLAAPIHVAAIFSAWALVYLVEFVVRDRFGLRRHLLLPEVQAAGVSAVVLGGAAVASAASPGRPLIDLIYAGCYLAAGWAPLQTGLRALRHKTIDVELLMVIAALCAAGTGNAFDGALLFVIFSSSRALAAIATRRTQESVRSLLTLTPEHARRITADGREELVPATALGVADEIVVRPGERIGADGNILAGSSEVDQASVTGEPMPVTKHPGDEVFAGTVNGVGTLRITVTRRGAESVVARIVAQVEQASTTKAKTQVVLEHFERRYSVGVVAATVAILVLPFVLGTSYRPGLLRAMAFMIVASPCSLTLATMPALLAAVADAGRHGALVKGAAVMERLGKVTTIAFDKTGSLTLGAPEVVEVLVLPACAFDGDDVVRLAAAADRGSEHPLADAVLKGGRGPGTGEPRGA